MVAQLRARSPLQVLEPRLAGVEARLEGVTNLAGRMMALDQVAEELGVAVPGAQVCGAERTRQSAVNPFAVARLRLYVLT